MKIKLFLFFLLISKTFANGGPVDWTGVTPLGGIRLKSVKGISLKKEELTIKINNDLNNYKALATYHLINSGKEKKIKFGVPLTWSNEEEYKIEPTKDEVKKIQSNRSKILNKQTSNILIKLNNKKYLCTIMPFNSFPQTKDPYPKELKTKRYCVTTISVKSGLNKLNLTYSASLNYVDSVFSKSSLTKFKDRVLLYELHPAGYWEGNLENLDIKIDLGLYKNYIKKISLQGYQKKGSSLIWKLQNVDLKKLKLLKIIFDSQLLEKKEISLWNKKAKNYQKIKMKASATSELKTKKGQKYKASFVLDGDPSTAWCEGKKDEGIHEKIRLYPTEGKDFRSTNQYYCRLEGVSISPGYQKSQKTYLNNNRVKKIKISDCENKNSFIHDINLANDYLVSPVIISNKINEQTWEKYNKEFKKKHGNNFAHPDFQKNSPKPPLKFINYSKCLEFEILKVKKGKVNDTCISEISLIINCG